MFGTDAKYLIKSCFSIRVDTYIIHRNISLRSCTYLPICLNTQQSYDVLFADSFATNPRAI